MSNVPIIVSLHPDQASGVWPVTVGVPFGKGDLALSDASELFVRASSDGDVREYQAQCVPLAMWSEEEASGVRWLLVDFMVDATFHQQEPRYELVAGQLDAALSPLILTKDAPGPHQLTVDVGLGTRFVIDCGQAFGISSVDHGGVLLVSPNRPQKFQVTRARGKENISHEAVCTGYEVEDEGPVRIAIRFEGHYETKPEGELTTDFTPERFCRFIIRMHFHARSRLVKVLHTFIYTGDERNMDDRISDLSMEIPLSSEVFETEFGIDAEALESTLSVNGPAALLQDRDGRFKPYLRLLESPELGGLDSTLKPSKSAGWIDLGTPIGGVALGLRHAWQSYPNELESRDDTLFAHLWPKHGDRLLDYGHENILNFYQVDELPPSELTTKRLAAIRNAPNIATGSARSHELWIEFRRGTSPNEVVNPMAMQCHSPAFAAGSPKHNCSSEALGPIHPVDHQKYPKVEAALSSMFERYRVWRDMTGGYGWFDFFDVHDQVTTRLLSSVDGGLMPSPYRYWGSGHYGFPLAPWILFYRSGERSLLDDAEANARHCMDVDRCHYTDANRGTLAGTHHEGDTSLVHWGGKATGSNYIQLEYLLYFYYLRGDRRALEVVLDYADGILDVLDPSFVLPKVETDHPFMPAAALEDGRFTFEHARHLGAPIGNFVELYRAALVPQMDGDPLGYVPENLREPNIYMAVVKAYYTELAKAYVGSPPSEHEAYSGKLRWVWDGLLNLARLTPNDLNASRLIRLFAELESHEGTSTNFVSTAAAFLYGDVDPQSQYSPEDILSGGVADLADLIARVCVEKEGSSHQPAEPEQSGAVSTEHWVGSKSLTSMQGDGGLPGAIRYPYQIRSIPFLLAAMESATATEEIVLGKSCSINGPRISSLRLRRNGSGEPRLLIRLGPWQAFRLTSPSGESSVHGELHEYLTVPELGWSQHNQNLSDGEFTPTQGLVLLTASDLSEDGDYRIVFYSHPTRYHQNENRNLTGDYIERGRADLVRVLNLHIELDPIATLEGDETLGGPWPGRICAFGQRFFFRAPITEGKLTIRMRIPWSWAGFGFTPAIELRRHEGTADQGLPSLVTLHGHEPNAEEDDVGGSGDLIEAHGQVKDPLTHEVTITLNETNTTETIWSLGPFPRVEAPYPNVHNAETSFRPAHVHDTRWFQIELPDGTYASVSPSMEALFPAGD